MLSDLDTMTLSVTFMLVSVIDGFVLLAAAFVWRGIRGSAWWAAANIVSAVVSASYLVSGGAKEPGMIFLATVLSYAIMYLSYCGVTYFHDARGLPRFANAVVIVGIAGAAATTLIWPDQSLRGAVFGLCYSALLIAIILLFLRHAPRANPAAHYLLALLHGCVLAMVIYRSIAVAFEQQIGPAASVHVRDVVTMLVATMFSIGRTFAYGLMVVARLQNEIARFAEAMRREAERDVLTGLANRRKLEEFGATQFALWRRNRRKFAVVAIDFDHFKNLNDTFGHAFGDLALREAGACIGAIVRDCDLAARAGGEEFVLVLPETEAVQAVVLGERVRAAVAALRIDDGDRKVGLTASVGVAGVDETDADFDAVAARADRALYLAKEGGRNRCAML